MEETRLPLTLSSFPAEVPLLPSIEYDFGGLDDFPSRLGFISSDLRDLDYRSAEDSASLVQSWLFFGLLADLTDTLVDRQGILHTSAYHHISGRRILVYPTATQHPELGLRMPSSLEKSNLKVLSRKIRDVVQIGIDNVERIDHLDVAWRHPMPLILLSVKILLCDLAAMRVGRLGVYSSPWDGGLEEPRLVPYPFDSSFVSSSAKALEGLMLAKGWCPSQIHLIGSTCDYSMVHYLSKIDRRISEKTTHELCSSKHCQAYNSAPDSYVTSHTVSSCQCSFIPAPTEQLSEIIRSGGFPLISLHEASHGKLKVHVHASRAKSQYTAISHVWSGGLGNIQANSLPLCQLKYINRCLLTLPKDGERGFNYKKNAFSRDLSGKVWISPLGLDNLVSPRNCKPKLFWMDTLCIPVGLETSDLRMKAINKMDAVYAHAREILVLDTEIQKLSINHTHPCELLTRLAYSSWMGRSWTLQEGAIGRAAYFQCADGAMTLERSKSEFVQQSLPSLVVLGFRGLRSIIRHRATKIDCSEMTIGQSMGHERVENVLLKVLLNSLHRGRSAKTDVDMNMTGLIPEDEQLDSFVSIWNELIKRSTTKPEDIFAIFANLLDFNAGQIINLPQDERMKAIIWSSSKIPFSLLYNTGSRSKDSEGLRDRWVPTVPKGSELTKSPSMKFAEDGHSFRLAVAKDERQPLAMIVYVDSLPLCCYLLDTESEKTYFVKPIRSVNDTMNTIIHQEICIIIEPFLRADREDVDHHTLTFAPGTRGVCLFVTSRKSLCTTTPERREQSSTQPSKTPTYEKNVLSTVYDCPVQIWEVNDTASIPETEVSTFKDQDGQAGCPTFHCAMLRQDYELHLETGICDMKIVGRE